MSSKYTISTYIRLSLEDKNEGESNSVKNQRDLLNQFLDKHSELSRHQRIEICDDGYSGTNFNRPGVMELLDKVREQEINCIVVKDFSRFGRSYIEVGNYLEQVFPFLGVRFISVNDNFDSNNTGASATDLDVALKTLIYDLYSKDLSIKVKSAKQAKMKKGDFINPYAPYGYIKSKISKNKLEVDYEAAETVKLIYELAAAGKKPTEIAKILNVKDILSPNSYKASKKDGRNWARVSNNMSMWRDATIHKILRDERYTGAMVSRKYERMIVGNPNMLTHFSQDEWIVVPNTHEAIIPKALFDKVQASFKAKRQPPKKEKHILSGLIRCHFCKRTLHRRSPRKKGGGHYICPTTKLTDSPNCFTGSISEQMVYESILKTIQAHAALFVEIELKGKIHKTTVSSQLSELVKQIEHLKSESDKLSILKKESYESYKDGRISKGDYLSKREQSNGEIDNMKAVMDNISAKTQELKQFTKLYQTRNPWEKAADITELTRGLLEELVEAVIVYDAERFEINLRHTDIFYAG